MIAEKKWLRINDVDRMVVCNPETDSLADVLRRIGLTGTKVGCGAGQCGACTVLLNDKPVRACMKQAASLDDYASVRTIEGIGTPQHLHPLQRAWIKYGGVQCGFCSPGFIVSAYGLLLVNPAPTREQVRDWFQKHRNICRCTGYKPLVDAVMAAAAAMRGEVPLDSLDFQPPGDNRLYGTRVPKVTALAKVTGLCDYGDDIGGKMPEGTLHLAVVQPGVDHANILRIDTAAAEAMPGVVKVITAKDVRGTNRVTMVQDHPRATCNGQVKPILNDEKLFRFGDIVAVVAATSRALAREAAKQVKVEWEELPAYRTALESLAPGAQPIHRETPNQFCMSRVDKGADTREMIPQAAYTVEGSFSSSRQPHLPIEPDVMQAYWDREGRMTVQSKSQSLHYNAIQMADGIGLPVEKIRIIQNPVGGSFGYSMTPGAPALMAVCAMACGVPVTLTMSYAEHMAFTGKRAPSYTNARMACDREGNIIALEYDMTLETGAYPEETTKLVDKAIRFVGNPYRVPNINGVVRGVISNSSFGIMFRAFASPQAYTSSEALMDMMARKIGMDPFEFRYKNIAREGDLTVNSHPYHEYPMVRMMDMMRPFYLEAVERAAAGSTDGKQRGVGLAWGGYHVGLPNDKAVVELELNEDGGVTFYNSWAMVGQGADMGSLVHAHEALRPLGIKPQQIRLVMNDTAITPFTGPASGSRSHYMVGNATMDAASKLMKAMEQPGGGWRTHGEMVAQGIPTRYEGVCDTSGYTSLIDPDNGHGNANPAANYMLILAEVEVEVATGKTRVVRMTEVSDVGVVGSVLAVEGQAYGGFSHSVGFALSEDYSDWKRHASMAGAGIPAIDAIPDEMNLLFHVTPRERGPHGSSGCAEGYQSSGHMAIINAIEDAVGVRIYELPATPAKVKAALAAKAEGRELKPGKYDFGSEFYETFDYFDKNPISKGD